MFPLSNSAPSPNSLSLLPTNYYLIPFQHRFSSLRLVFPFKFDIICKVTYISQVCDLVTREHFLIHFWPLFVQGNLSPSLCFCAFRQQISFVLPLLAWKISASAPLLQKWSTSNSELQSCYAASFFHCATADTESSRINQLLGNTSGSKNWTPNNKKFHMT